jgi:hypothetical protein
MNEVELEKCNIVLAKRSVQEKWKEWKIILSVRKGFSYTL